MKIGRTLGTILLSLWLVATGLTHFLNIHFAGYGALMAILAIAAGILLLVGR